MPHGRSKTVLYFSPHHASRSKRVHTLLWFHHKRHKIHLKDLFYSAAWKLEIESSVFLQPLTIKIEETLKSVHLINYLPVPF
jgi:hypothetical protein